MEGSWGAWPSHLALLRVFSRLWPQNALLGHWTSIVWFCSCTVQWGFAASLCKKKFPFACGNSNPGLRFSLLDILILQPPVITLIPTSCCPGTQILTRSVPLSANLCYRFAVSLADAAAYLGCFSSLPGSNFFMGTQENRQVLGSRECMGEKAIFLILIILELETQELQLTGAEILWRLWTLQVNFDFVS